MARSLRIRKPGKSEEGSILRRVPVINNDELGHTIERIRAFRPPKIPISKQRVPIGLHKLSISGYEGKLEAALSSLFPNPIKPDNREVPPNKAEQRFIALAREKSGKEIATHVDAFRALNLPPERAARWASIIAIHSVLSSGADRGKPAVQKKIKERAAEIYSFYEKSLKKG